MRPRRGDAASIIDANTHYSIQIQRSGIGEDNDVEVADERMFFYVLAVRTHLQNPKVMPNHSSVSGKACLRLNVQYMDVWKAAGYDLDGRIRPAIGLCVLICLSQCLQPHASQ